MIRIAITQAAFEAIAATLPLGSVGYENQINERGERLIWLSPEVVNPLWAMRGPGETTATSSCGSPLRSQRSGRSDEAGKVARCQRADRQKRVPLVLKRCPRARSLALRKRRSVSWLPVGAFSRLARRWTFTNTGKDRGLGGPTSPRWGLSGRLGTITPA
jgi:hypothetical protein